ncbi:hypothetical protein HYPSUDRAFT_195778 [Hypholoma sublateritium FD-334 SS-4]|uniref:Fungal-type protein kinase domain-containing protein n=1 Tax=Hypholoma sublateritium (strain FD-334 SS-4) TaxID=945553 RepID=A0A0D2N9R9_HYPSF|nr:hypothetical protein HYPSUDRAFT_195778 [Hypholoma sublateritium FD-334 SS-4]
MFSLKETPLKLDWASSGVFIKGTLHEQRQAVANDLGGGIPEVGIAYMLEHILPKPPSEVDADASLRILEARNTWSPTGGWSAFNGLTPAQMKGSEEAIFNENMETIVKNILGNCKFVDGNVPLRGVGIGTSPHLAPVSPTNIRSRPDACGLLEAYHPLHTSNWYTEMPEEGHYHWFNIVYTLEYKKKNTVDSRNDNVLKILWSLHHVMNTDHRRRFAFGITIENTIARVWYCCRQIVMVSTPFNFITEPQMFIKIFTSLHYSDISSVGFDPTMTYIWNREEDKIQRRIVVHQQGASGSMILKTYITTGDIISDESQIIRSRATRVYEAYDISDSSKTPVVIKDIWVDVNRKLEACIIAEVLENATEDEKSLFLTVLFHGIVQINDQSDLTEGPNIMRGLKFSTGGHNIMGSGGRNQPGIFILQQRKERVELSDTASSHSSLYTEKMVLFSTNVVPYTGEQSNPPVPSGFYTASKAHYRLVFKERGHSLHHLTLQCKMKLSSVLIPALCDIIRALKVMWKTSYVHRDVSAANIIIYKGRARLVDLEFAKKYAMPPSNPVRTASYSFQATEQLSENYLLGGIGKPIFNPLHDLESLWWISIWFTFCHFPLCMGDSNDTFVSHLTGPQTQQAIEEINFVGHVLFRLGNEGKPNINARTQALVDGLFLQDAQLDRYKFPATVRNFCKILDNFRDKLVGHFLKASQTSPNMSVVVHADYFSRPEFTTHDDLLDDFGTLGLAPNDQSSSQSSAMFKNVDYHLWPMKLLQDQLTRP